MRPKLNVRVLGDDMTEKRCDELWGRASNSVGQHNDLCAKRGGSVHGDVRAERTPHIEPSMDTTARTPVKYHPANLNESQHHRE